MARIKTFFLTLAALMALPIVLTCRADDTASMVDRINQRYDDFFRVRQAQEEREERFKHGVDERKKLEQAHAKEIEKAREAYVKARKARPDDRDLQRQWENGQKERQAELEMRRRGYVQQRATAEQYLLKGRKIPELKEFDLENY